MSPVGYVTIPLIFPIDPATDETYIFQSADFRIEAIASGVSQTLTVTRSGCPPKEATSLWLQDCIRDVAQKHALPA